jgi:hypothetical protein
MKIISENLSFSNTIDIFQVFNNHICSEATVLETTHFHYSRQFYQTALVKISGSWARCGKLRPVIPATQGYSYSGRLLFKDSLGNKLSEAPISTNKPGVASTCHSSYVGGVSRRGLQSKVSPRQKCETLFEK